MIITIVSAAHGGQEEKRLGGGGRGAGTVAAAHRPTAVRGLTSWAACTTDPACTNPPLVPWPIYQGKLSTADILALLKLPQKITILETVTNCPQLAQIHGLHGQRVPTHLRPEEQQQCCSILNIPLLFVKILCPVFFRHSLRSERSKVRKRRLKKHCNTMQH